MTLPLSDRIALFVSRGARTARTLSIELGADVATVHKTLGGLEEAGVVRRLPRTSPILWSTHEEVEVEYRPGRVHIHSLKEDEPPDLAEEPDGKGERCTAITSRGSRCKLTARTDGLCGHHAS